MSRICIPCHRLFLSGVQLFAQGDAEFLAQTLESFEVLLVLVGVLDLGFDTCWVEM
jgi:hypothetical protein